MILLVDADSLIFASCLKKRETPIDHPFYLNIEDCKHKFDEQFMKIVNDLEEKYYIEKVMVFNGSRGNFRKYIGKTYKKNRDKITLPPLLGDMHKYVYENYKGIRGYGVETDDMVARHWHKLSQQIGRDNVMIVSIDKDYKQFPCLIYNYHYKHRVIINISEQEALYNFYEQMIAGDVADNVNYFKGKGKSFAKKYYLGCKTKYQYTRRLYELFQKEYKSKARQRYSECYSLLKLRTD